MRDRRLLLVIPVVVALVVVAVLVAVSRNGSAAPASAADLTGVSQAMDLVSGIPSHGDTLGDPAAKVTVVEYGDLRCPVCAAYSQQELPTVVSDLVRTGKAKLQLRLWPITQPIADAQTAAQAGYAAAKQDSLWLFADIWYANQGNETSTYATPDYIHAIATGAGLDIAKLDVDRSSPAARDAWVAADAAAQHLGLTGTPSFVVIGPGGQKAFTTSVPTADEIARAVQAVSA